MRIASVSTEVMLKKYSPRRSRSANSAAQASPLCVTHGPATDHVAGDQFAEPIADAVLAERRVEDRNCPLAEKLQSGPTEFTSYNGREIPMGLVSRPAVENAPHPFRVL